MMQTATTTILWFDQPESSDIGRVGGKNAGLSEVTRTLATAGIRVPPGFATTADAYRSFIGENGLAPKLRKQLEAYHSGADSLADAGNAIRRMVVDAGIDSMSLNPDSFVATCRVVAEAEKKLSVARTEGPR